MIAFLSVFPPFRGGISRFSDHVLHQLQLHDSVVPINYIRQYPSLLFPGKTQLDPNQLRHHSIRFLHAYNPINWLKSTQTILPSAPNHFIYTHWHPFFVPSTLSMIVRLRKWNPEIRISGIVHNVLPHEPFPLQEKLVSTLFEQSDRIFTLSTQGSQALSVFKQASNKSIQLFHPIYEHNETVADRKTLRQNWKIPENAFVFLFFGLIREYKGLSLLIEAFNEIAEQRGDIHLVVAGEFYEPQTDYEEQIQPEFQHRVHIHNHFLSNQEVAEVLSLSDVLVLPYKRATQSGVLADAIAYNLPAIATNEPGFTDFLTDKVNGLIMKERNTEELIRNMLALNLQHVSQLKEGMKHMKHQFSWERFGKELFDNLPN